MRRRLITHPRFQLTFTFYFVVGCLAIFILIGGVNIVTLLLLASDPLLTSGQRGILVGSSKQILGYLLLICSIATTFFIFMGGYLSYKFIGPLFRLELWLKHCLDEKKYIPFKMRNRDDLEAVIQILNRLLLKKFHLRATHHG